MATLVVGFIVTLAILVVSAGTESFSSYIQMHSILLVIGGTLSILLFSTPATVLRSLLRSLKALFKPDENFDTFKSELIQLSKTKKTGKKSSHPLIFYAQELWEQGIDPNLFIVLLSQKRNELETATADATQSLKNLSKYPPTLGMAGTVMGMIALFNQLDQQKDNIGKSLALAMTATFFGLIFSNAVISPLADRLQVVSVNQRRTINHIYQVLLLINQGEPSALVSGEVEQRVA